MKTAALAFLAALALCGGAQTQAQAQAAPAACPVSADHVRANGELQHSRAAATAGSLTILAMGSSSIEGVGASRPELGFVPLLQAGLASRLPGVEVTVVNRGIGGETARETADRLETEIAAHRPDLVIWQLGTNDVLRDRTENEFFADFQRGQETLRRAGVDVLLIDPQRLPEDTTNANFKGRNPALKTVADLISAEASRSGLAVLRRFDAMAAWDGLTRGGVGPDDLHLNDDGYACWAAVTAEGLAPLLR